MLVLRLNDKMVKLIEKNRLFPVWTFFLILKKKIYPNFFNKIYIYSLIAPYKINFFIKLILRISAIFESKEVLLFVMTFPALRTLFSKAYS